MGAQPLLRVAVLVGTLSAALAPSPARAGGLRLAVIDLGGGDGRWARLAEVRHALAGIEGIAATEPDLTAALAAMSPGELRGREAVDRAALAFAAPDCKAARTEVAVADLALANAEASGGDVAEPLRRAWGFELLCADQAGDRAAAQAAADHLHGLGDAAPAGVADAVWQRYPTIDALGDQQTVAVQIRATGAVWIDHVAAGVAPLTVYLREGDHVVATAGAAERVTVGPATTALALESSAARDDVRATIAAWRAEPGLVTRAAIGVLLTRVALRFAIVIEPDGQLTVWGKKAHDHAARRLGAAASTLAAAALAEDQAAAWTAGPGIDPTIPLLREDPSERAERAGGHEKWWVYGAVVGAAAIGAGLIIANQLADDRQEIHIHSP